MKKMPEDVLMEIETGDFINNEDVDTSCARRLLYFCKINGEDGKEAEKLLRMAFQKLEVYV